MLFVALAYRMGMLRHRQQRSTSGERKWPQSFRDGWIRYFIRHGDDWGPVRRAGCISSALPTLRCGSASGPTLNDSCVDNLAPAEVTILDTFLHSDWGQCLRLINAEDDGSNHPCCWSMQRRRYPRHDPNSIFRSVKCRRKSGKLSKMVMLGESKSTAGGR
jgi:hypothetical protein